MQDDSSHNSWSKTVPPSPVTPKPAVPSTVSARSSSATRTMFFVLGGFVALFFVIVGIYIGAMNTTPRIVAPNHPPAPKQNGFPLLKAATTKTKRDKDAGDAIARVPKKAWTKSEKHQLVAANRAAIDASRQALSVPYMEELRNVGINTKYPYYAKFRSMARIFVLAGNVAWDDGNQREAADNYLDAITIGRRVPNRTPLIGRLVGIACEAIGRRPVWDRLERLDADSAAHCLARLQVLESEQLPMWVTLEEEKYNIQRIALEAMEHPDRPPFWEADESSSSEEDESSKKIMTTYGHLVPRKYVTDTLGQHMDKVIAQSKQHYITSKQEIPVPKEIYTAILVPVISKARLKFVANETGDTLLRTALALRIYRLRNGTYPTQLSDLVTAKLLPRVPDDPFAMPGTALTYKRLPTGKYLLYSIGPDSIDDHGKGLMLKSTAGTTVRYIDANSKGDVVAGWYTY